MKHKKLLLKLSGFDDNKWPEDQKVEYSLDLLGIIDEFHFDQLIDNLIPLIKEYKTSETKRKRVGFGEYESDDIDADFVYLSHKDNGEEPRGS